MLSPMSAQASAGCHDLPDSMVSILSDRLAAMGIDVTVFRIGGAIGADSEQGGESGAAAGGGEPADFSLHLSQSLQLSELFEQAGEFDLIHNHCGCLPVTYSGMTATPLLSTLYEAPSERSLQVYGRYAHRVSYVAVSEASRCPALDYIATIHPALDLRRYSYAPDDGEYLLTLDAVSPEGAGARCIEVARSRGMKLKIAGIVEDQEHFDRHVRPHLDGGQVVYTGPVTGSDQRRRLLAGACGLVYHDERAQTWPLWLVEAMACGTPVIALKRGAVGEIVADGITGFVIDDAAQMGDAVARLEQLDRLQCRKWVEQHFDADRMAQAYMELYESIIRRVGREDHRPWGFYEVLSDTAVHKVKRITIRPGQRLSYQRHFHRSEHWYILQGRAVVTRNGVDTEVGPGDALDSPVETWHRIHNPGSENVVFIEIQTGEYFGEDDIERAEDDYGRV
ncbi:MAG: glycosyltransferase [candidate division WS1 bacterium]|nr:glycosyltransferase [candidate division WS1 bacterium]